MRKTADTPGIRGERFTVKRLQMMYLRDQQTSSGKEIAERAEEARAEAQEHADASARATQNAKQQAAALAERHNEATSKLELDIEAYRRSESMLQQKLDDLSAELATEKQRHAELSEEQSSTHAAHVRSLMAEITQHQKQQSVENNEQLVAQRQLMELEERGIEQRKAALHKQQELERALRRKFVSWELLVLITKSIRSSFELSCVNAKLRPARWTCSAQHEI